MNDFKTFLEKVLSPTQSDSEPRQQQPESAVDTNQAPDSSDAPEGEMERRYVEVMNTLLRDAEERQAVHVFADVVAWKLAVVAYRSGPWGAGDILSKLGHYLVSMSEREMAAREAKAAEKAGRRPN